MVCECVSKTHPGINHGVILGEYDVTFYQHAPISGCIMEHGFGKGTSSETLKYHKHNGFTTDSLQKYVDEVINRYRFNQKKINFNHLSFIKPYAALGRATTPAFHSDGVMGQTQ
jgi:hypothetical protein